MGARYIGSIRIIARVGKVAYRLDLLDGLIQIHITLHISQLQKILVYDSTVLSLDDIHINECLNYVERLTVVLNKKTKNLHDKDVGLVKV